MAGGMDFYLRDTNHPDGPHDLMAVIRKIRNGSITEKTLISVSIDGPPIPAGEMPELKECFEEELNGTAGIASVARPPKGFKSFLTFGMDVLRSSTSVSIYSGLYIIIWLILCYMLVFSGWGKAVVGTALCYFFLGGYQYTILRQIRGNPVEFSIILSRLMAVIVPLGIVSFIFGALMMPFYFLVFSVFSGAWLGIGLPILFICLLGLLTLFAFAPLYIMDRERDFWDAIRDSVSLVMRKKGHWLGIVFGLISLNFLLILLLPVVLPITMSALADIYDENS